MYKKKYLKNLSKDSRIISIFNKCKETLNIKKNIKIINQNLIKIPSICGYINPKLLITSELEKFTDEEIQNIFLHELMHYKKADTLIYFLLNVIKSIYWFNPFIYLEIKVLKSDLEVVTDIKVIELDRRINIKNYCQTIIKVALLNQNNLFEMPSIYTGKKDLERRIKYMKSYKGSTSGMIILLIMVVGLICMASLSLAASKNIDTSNYVLSSTENTKVDKLSFPLKEKNVTISSVFGKIYSNTNKEIIHNGVDIVADAGTEVFAIADGKVVKAEFNVEKGNYIRIEHNGITSEYCHLSEILITEGENVTQNKLIGKVGSTGYATGTNLHFGIINEEGQYVNPLENYNM